MTIKKYLDRKMKLTSNVSGICFGMGLLGFFAWIIWISQVVFLYELPLVVGICISVGALVIPVAIPVTIYFSVKRVIDKRYKKGLDAFSSMEKNLESADDYWMRSKESKEFVDAILKKHKGKRLPIEYAYFYYIRAMHPNPIDGYKGFVELMEVSATEMIELYNEAKENSKMVDLFDGKTMLKIENKVLHNKCGSILDFISGLDSKHEVMLEELKVDAETISET